MISEGQCEICGGKGYHKLSCTNNSARVAIPMIILTEYEAAELIHKPKDP
jgi:hypothetical protein